MENKMYLPLSTIVTMIEIGSVICNPVYYQFETDKFPSTPIC